MVKLKRLKNMINDCIAVGEDSLKVRPYQENEHIEITKFRIKVEMIE